MEDLFNKPGDDEIRDSHIYLLTAGAVSNVEKVIDLVKRKRKRTGKSRLHTFGVGRKAN